MLTLTRRLVPHLFNRCQCFCAMNPLLKHNQLPMFDNIKTEHMKSALEICLVNLEEHYIEFENKLTNSSTVDYKKIFHTLETIKSPLKFSR